MPGCGRSSRLDLASPAALGNAWDDALAVGLHGGYTVAAYAGNLASTCLQTHAVQASSASRERCNHGLPIRRCCFSRFADSNTTVAVKT